MKKLLPKGSLLLIRDPPRFSYYSLRISKNWTEAYSFLKILITRSNSNFIEPALKDTLYCYI